MSTIELLLLCYYFNWFWKLCIIEFILFTFNENFLFWLLKLKLRSLKLLLRSIYKESNSRMLMWLKSFILGVKLNQLLRYYLFFFMEWWANKQSDHLIETISARNTSGVTGALPTFQEYALFLSVWRPYRFGNIAEDSSFHS